MSDGFQQAHYHKPDMWNPAEWHERKADQERARLAAAWLPPEVSSVLDVGCGNGIFTNLEEPTRTKTGVDMSRTALSHVTAPCVQADAAWLPFDDNRFDASLSMEMLEHLPNAVYRTALQEIVRVARSYILITVPYNEKLTDSRVTCPACQCMFHPYHHVRQYRREAFETLLGRHSRLIRLEAIVPTQGMALPGLWNLIRLAYHRGGRHFPAHAVCPQCGYTPDKQVASAQTGPQAQAKRGTMRHWWLKRATYTWWMALYQKGAQG